MDVKSIELIGIIGFDGTTKNGLRLHPDQRYLIYPMGNKITIKEIASGEQYFLTGHTNLISALCVSPCGNFVASGQINHLGFKAMVIIWDYNQRVIKGSYEIHKVRVEDVCFTSNSDYLISLGGRDDGNVIIWDVRNNDAMCGTFASNETVGNTYSISRMNTYEQCFLTGGDRNLKIWKLDARKRKLYGFDVKMGKLRRSINCIVINEKDQDAYCGTTSGDIIKSRLNYRHEEEHAEPVMVGCYSKISKKIKNGMKIEGESYAGGINNLLLLENGRMIVGAGDGTVELIEIGNIEYTKVTKYTKMPSTPQIITHLTENVCSSVTSMVLYKKNFILVGTVLCEIYQIRLSDFDMRLLLTCHTSSIYSIVFPCNYSEIFATGGKNDIRLWRLETQKELLRITVSNFVCSSLCFTHNGRMIISAWNDGIIRAFTPQSGKLIFAIHNAHVKAVSAVAVTIDDTRIISGGCDGQVRIWNLKVDAQKLIAILKEHRGPITSLSISSNKEEFISSSTDGACIIWDVVRCVRKQVLMGNTMYMSACFSRNGIQILTCGTDRKIAYWETWDGSLLREIEGSSSGALNCIDTSPDGKYFVTGSNDCIVKLWEYHTANITHIGVGHAAIITACRFSSDGKHIVTVSADGAIIVWRFPLEFLSTETSNETLEVASLHEKNEKELEKLNLKGIEDVTHLSHVREATDSVRTAYDGVNLKESCTRTSVGEPSNVCNCANEKIATPVSVKNESVKSVKSAKSISSGFKNRPASLQSNKSVPKIGISTQQKSPDTRSGKLPRN